MIPGDETETTWENPPPDEICRILKNSPTIAVVGLSSDSARPSYNVGFYLKNHGYRVIPVNPRETEVLGEKSYPTLKSIPEMIHIVDVFRKPDAVPAIVEGAIEIGAKAVWLQESVISVDAFLRGRQAGLLMVMDRCIRKEHRRLISA